MVMNDQPTPETKNKNELGSDPIKETGQLAISSDLSSDSDYVTLIEFYQQGKFSKCKNQLEELEKRYPGHPDLIKFKDQFQMKLSFNSMRVSSRKEEQHKKVRGTLKVGVFAVTSVIFILLVFFFSYYYLSKAAAENQLAEKLTRLSSLNSQAEELLAGGQPAAAEEIIALIEAIDPAYENLPELTSQADALLALDTKYNSALNLLAENKEDEALEILKEIEAEESGLWDVSQQIDSIETFLQIAEFLAAGDAAYQEEDWGRVISAYENAMLLDPKLDDPLMTEHLLRGYLNMIITLLQSDESSIEDIETAESYYRKAVALIPQSKEYASERENLQEMSSNLLVLKFAQTAEALLADKNQTVLSIADAVTYMGKAANLEPNNTASQLDLQNAEYYQIAFQDFIEMNWGQAITNLNEIVSVDSDFAGGNASMLLFEAYYALGTQYYSASFYQDALTNLEQAELVAWKDTDNLLKLFQVQVRLGDTYSGMKDLENGASYYQYALNAIDAVSRLTDYPALATKITEANYYYAVQDYENAVVTYQDVIQDIDVIYSFVEVEIDDGVCLAFFADDNLSTLDAVIEANNLSNNMVVTFGRTLMVPIIEN